MADENASTNASHTPRALDDVVAGVLSHPDFRRMIDSPSNIPTTQRSTNQSPVEEFRALFRATRQPARDTPRFQARSTYNRPNRPNSSVRCRPSPSSTSTSTTLTKNKQTKTVFCREVILLNRADADVVVRGHNKAELYKKGNVISAFEFNKSWSADEVRKSIEEAFHQLKTVNSDPK